MSGARRQDADRESHDRQRVSARQDDLCDDARNCSTNNYNNNNNNINNNINDKIKKKILVCIKVEELETY